MSEEAEHRCFIGGLSYSTTDRSLKDAFKKFGELLDAKVSVDKFSGRARGFGFITFKEKRDMEDAIKAMNGVDLDGRDITVEKAQAQGSGRDRGGDRPRDNRDRDYGRDRDRGRGSGGGDCFKCGKPGHFARECPDGEGGGGGRYGSRDGGGGGGRYSGRDDRDGGGGGRDRDRSGERYGGRSRDSDRDGGGGGGGDRYSRGDRSGPYERRGSGRDRS